jgi:GT2 family glycosyltransferase
MHKVSDSSAAAVGIVTRDRAPIARKAIDSALAQSYPNIQVWVLNDHSVDETASLASEYPNIGFIDNPVAQGCIEARNGLMNLITADYFVSLDDDAWFLANDEVAVAIDYLERNRNVGVIAFDILSPDKPEARSRTEPRIAGSFIGCGHVIRMSDFRRVGGYVRSPGPYGSEEKDLALRLLDIGQSVVLLPGVHVWHDKTHVARVHPSQHRSGVCNDLVMTVRRAPLIALPFALLSKLYRHARFSFAHGLAEPFREGLDLFWFSLAEVWKTRRPVRLTTLRRFMRLSRTVSA